YGGHGSQVGRGRARAASPRAHGLHRLFRDDPRNVGSPEERERGLRIAARELSSKLAVAVGGRGARGRGGGGVRSRTMVARRADTSAPWWFSHLLTARVSAVSLASAARVRRAASRSSPRTTAALRRRPSI